MPIISCKNIYLSINQSSIFPPNNIKIPHLRMFHMPPLMQPTHIQPGLLLIINPIRYQSLRNEYTHDLLPRCERVFIGVKRRT
mmetsp:Transcript_31100/g.67270  ORF Transcript_31100/g.67270 Transcript_31100/m.67270 type:complete len:83 (-) Transcript_31100:822-1070(-)